MYKNVSNYRPSFQIYNMLKKLYRDGHCDDVIYNLLLTLWRYKCMRGSRGGSGGPGTTPPPWKIQIYRIHSKMTEIWLGAPPPPPPLLNKIFFVFRSPHPPNHPRKIILIRACICIKVPQPTPTFYLMDR